jgi:hypothetical protein
VKHRHSAILTDRDLWLLTNTRDRRDLGDNITRFDPTTLVGDEVARRLGGCEDAGTGDSYSRIEKITLHPLADEDDEDGGEA